MTVRQFFDDYFNVSKLVREKRRYRRQMARIRALPEDYQYMFRKMQEWMWSFASGAGYDMMELHGNLLELFEAGAAEGRTVLEITGRDVAAFCDALLRGVRTWTEDRRRILNREVLERLEPGCLPD